MLYKRSVIIQRERGIFRLEKGLAFRYDRTPTISFYAADATATTGTSRHLYRRGMPHSSANWTPLRGWQPVLERYLEARRAQQSSAATISRFDSVVRHFTAWSVVVNPTIETFTDVTRDHILAYAATLQTNSANGGAVVSIETKISRLSTLSVFLQDTAAWGWKDAPTHSLIGARDLPKRLGQLPRYIPADELERLIPAIRRLTCPYQRTALIVARWSGARRSEIRNLETAMFG